MNNLAFRACLEKVVTNLNIKLTKRKRRSLPANVNENITSYTKAVLTRFRIVGTDFKIFLVGASGTTSSLSIRRSLRLKCWTAIENIL